MPLNYSKWDKIELSDDEDNFHPNIDNNLMIRLQREKRQQREQEEAEMRKELQSKIDKGEDADKAGEELAKLDRLQKLHVGNICQDKFSSKHEKSSASASANPSTKKESKLQVVAPQGESFVEGYEEFISENLETLKEYAAIDEEDEKSEAYILKHTQLLSEHATGYYLLRCINLEAAGKTREMRKTARQYLLLTYVCDLAKSMPGRDARDAIKPLFKKMDSNAECREAFAEHLSTYIKHVKTRAEVKKKEDAERADEEGGEEEYEYVELKKGEQVGPGGLDPAEVFETLPDVLKDAFGERSVDALKKAIAGMDQADAEYHMKRCVDSGLWDPTGGAGAPAAAEGEADDSTVSAEVDDD